MAPSISARDNVNSYTNTRTRLFAFLRVPCVAWEDLSWLVYLSPFVYHTAKIMQFSRGFGPRQGSRQSGGKNIIIFVWDHFGPSLGGNLSALFLFSLPIGRLFKLLVPDNYTYQLSSNYRAHYSDRAILGVPKYLNSQCSQGKTRLLN